MHSENNGAQVATEYLVVVGASLVLIAFVTSYAFLMYSQAVSTSQSSEAIKELSSAINEVAAAGSGNQSAIQITLPENVKSITLQNGAVRITTTFFGADSDDVVEVDANVSGTITTKPGKHSLVVENINGGVEVRET